MGGVHHRAIDVVDGRYDLLRAHEDAVAECRLVAHLAPAAEPREEETGAQESEQERVGDWRAVWENLYKEGISGGATSDGSTDGGRFNIAGWVSSSYVVWIPDTPGSVRR